MDWRELTEGFWRKVVAANACYEILLVTKGWSNNVPHNKYYTYYCAEGKGIGLYRELLGITLTYEQAVELAEKDYEENCLKC